MTFLQGSEALAEGVRIRSLVPGEQVPSKRL